MNDGKLVRDLVPELIRQTGRHTEVQQLQGSALMRALGSKLEEEAEEVAGAVQHRAALIEELADLTDVIKALMKHHQISNEDVAQAAREGNAARRFRQWHMAC